MPAGELLRLHVLGASGRLAASARTLTDTASAAFVDAAALLDLGEEPIDVVIRDAPATTVPELGIGGVAPDSWTIFVGLDPMHPTFDQAIRGQLAQTMAHELHHLARRRAGCRGTTLWDAVVHEGLADRFVVELYETSPPPWSLAITGAHLERLYDRARTQQDGDLYDHAIWFYGKDPAEIPRWGAYALGWSVVGDYLERHPGAKASRLAGLPTDAFMTSLRSRSFAG